MKRVFAWIILNLYFVSAVFAGNLTGSNAVGKQFQEDSIVKHLPRDLTYYKDHRKGDTLTPDFTTFGHKTYTSSISRGASNPQTYFDADGVMQLNIVSNAYFQNHGYYDATGWHKAPSFFQQGAQTNYLKQTIFATDTDSDGRADDWNVYSDATNVPTFSLVAETLTNIPNSQAQRFEHTFSDGTQSILYSEPTAVGSFSQNDYATISMWLKGTGTIDDLKLYIREKDAGGTNGTLHSSSCILSSLSSSEWRRFTYTSQVTDGDLSRITAQVGVATSGGGQSTDLQIACPQLTKSQFPTSFIPTTTAALTRNQETLTYPVQNSFRGGDVNALLFDGTNDKVAIGDTSGSVTKIETEIKMLTDNNEIMSIQNSAATLISVVAGVLTFGGDLTGSGITVDGVSKSAAQAGVLLNDNDWHKLKFDLTSIAANNVQLGTDDGTNFGNFKMKELSLNEEVLAHYNFGEGAGATLGDIVGSNDGTIDGATWVKTVHESTIILKAMFPMLADEQPSDDRTLFKVNIDADNNWAIGFLDNADDKITALSESGGTTYNADSAALTWTRYASHTIALVLKTGAKAKLSIDGGAFTESGSNYGIPIGTIPSTLSLLPDNNCGIMWQVVEMHSRALSLGEIKAVKTLLEN